MPTKLGVCCRTHTSTLPCELQNFSFVVVIEAGARIVFGIETVFWLTRIQSNGEAGIIIVGRGHDKHSTRGTSGLGALLVAEIKLASGFRFLYLSVYLSKDASIIQIPFMVSYAGHALSGYAIG